MAGGKNRTTSFDRNTDDFGFLVRIAEFVSERCNQKPFGGSRIGISAFGGRLFLTPSHRFHAPIAHTRDAFLLVTVVPCIVDNSADRGHGARQEDAVSYRCDGWHLRVKRIGEIRTLSQKPVETAVVVLAKASQVIVPKLVYDDSDYEFRLLWLRCSLCRETFPQKR